MHPEQARITVEAMLYAPNDPRTAGLLTIVGETLLLAKLIQRWIEEDRCLPTVDDVELVNAIAKSAIAIQGQLLKAGPTQ